MSNATSTGVAGRPSTFMPYTPGPDSNPPPKALFKLRLHRVESGLDTLTGEPLKGDDARQWLRMWAGLPEVARGSDDWGMNAARLVRANDTEVVYLRDDGAHIKIAREVTYTRELKGDKWKRIRTVNVRVVSMSHGESQT